MKGVWRQYIFCRMAIADAFGRESLGDEMVRRLATVAAGAVVAGMAAVTVCNVAVAMTAVAVTMTAVVIAMTVIIVMFSVDMSFCAKSDRGFPLSSVVFVSTRKHEVEAKEVAKL